VAAALRAAGLADLSDSALHRALYSSDASLYRVVPTVVAHPRNAGEVAAALAVCRGLGVPVTCRGAGTSIAGNAIGAGVVLDFGKHMNRVLHVDPDASTATVQPGVVQDQLQRAVAPAGLRFGPDPSTRNRCTIGGMIGNNACGSRSLEYGRTSDNVLALVALTAAGDELRLTGPGEAGRPKGTDPAGTAHLPAGREGGAELAALREIAGHGLATIRTELGRFGRQVSGYALEQLLPERGFDVRRFLVGSEGTLAVVTEAAVRLVRDPAWRVLTVLGYPDMASAADAVPAILPFRPATCEGLDSRILDVVCARYGPAAVPELPRGSGWLFVEVTADSEAAAAARSREIAGAAGALGAAVVTDPRQAATLWRIREDGAGLSGRSPAGKPAWPGWEDSAVPPGSLGRYLRELDVLLAGHGLTGVPYGHFGDGCLHLRLDFPLERKDGRGVLRAFLLDAARLVTRHGGSLSGEHGDGRTRSELLPIMYSAQAMDLFRRVKQVFDPGHLLNPGVVVDPAPVDADVRVGPAAPVRTRLALSYKSDGGDFTAAVHRCVGVGKCVADTTGAGGVMCPSYLATRQEKDSTRGRARVLQEMVNGTLVAGGWRSPEVGAALDLCLACKACSSECPAGVDMAAYKAEVLHQAYRGRPRPRAHYTLGWLPRWARLASLAPRVPNAVLAAPGLGRIARFAAGIDPRRGLPSFAEPSFRSWYARHAGERARGGTPVMLVVDTFTNYFDPGIGVAAVTVLEDAGFSVSIPRRTVCCGLTWISTGQLDAARRMLRRAVGELGQAAGAGMAVVGLEPSCTATLRSDSLELLGSTEAQAVAASVRTLAEVLAAAPGWQPPSLRGTRVVAQPHCHHTAVMGWQADEALLHRAGAELTRVGGCCGLAGNFGVERGHYDVSAAVAGTALLPEVRSAGPGAVVLADGFSCRTQLADLAGRSGIHLAQLLARPAHGPGQETAPGRGLRRRHGNVPGR
jgi:FAD/FMN-containing dehydrogenase/Fe-S oxidoreductase